MRVYLLKPRHGWNRLFGDVQIVALASRDWLMQIIGKNEAPRGRSE